MAFTAHKIKFASSRHHPVVPIFQWHLLPLHSALASALTLECPRGFWKLSGGVPRRWGGWLGRYADGGEAGSTPGERRPHPFRQRPRPFWKRPRPFRSSITRQALYCKTHCHQLGFFMSWIIFSYLWLTSLISHNCFFIESRIYSSIMIAFTL